MGIYSGGRAVGDGGVGQLDIDGLGAVGEGIVKGGQGEAEAAGDEAVIKAQGAARAAHAGGQADGGVDVAQQGVGQVCIGGGADIGDVDTDDVGAGGGRVQANGVDDVVIGDTLFINRGGVGTQGDVNGLVDVGDGGGQVVTGTAGDGGRAVGDGGVGQLDIDGLGAVGEGIVKGGQGEAEAAGDEAVIKAQGAARAAHAGGQADGGVDVAQQGVGQVCIGGGADIGDVDTDDVGAGGGRVQANGVDDVVIGDTLFINRGGVGTQGDVNGLVDVGDGGGQVVTGTAGDGGRAVGDGGVGQLDIDGLGAVGEGIVKGGQGEAEAAGDEAVIKAQGAARAAHAGGQADGGVDVAQQGVGQVCIGGGADIGDVDTDDVGAGGGRVQANGVDDVVIGDTLFINRGGVGTQGDVNGLVDVGDGGGQVVTGTAGDGGRAVGDGGVGQLDIDGLGAVGEGIVKGGQGEAEAAGDEAVIKAQGAARAAHAGGQADGGVDVAQQGVGQVCIGGGADIGDVDTDDVGAGGGRVQANGVDDVVIGDTLFINRGGVGTQGDVNGLVDVGDGGGQVVTGTAGDGGRAVGDGGVGQLDIDGLGAVGEGIVKGGQGEAEAAGDEAVIKAQGAARAAHAGGQADGGVDVAQQGVGQVCIGGGADIGDVDTDDVGAGGGRVQANGVDDVVIGDTLFINRGGVGTQGDVNGLVDVGDGGGQVVTGTAGDGGRAVGDGGVGQLDIDGLGAVGEGIVKGGQGEAEAAGDEAVIKAQGAARAAHAGGQADGGVDVAQQGVGQVCIGGGADIGDVDTDDVGAGGGRVQANGVDDVVIGDTLFINRGGVGTQGDVNGLVDVGDGGGQVVTGTAGDGGRAVGDGGVGQLDIDGLGAVGEGIVKGGQGEAEAAGDEAVIKAQGAARAAHAGGQADGGVDVAQQGVGQVCIGGGADIGDVDTDDVGAGGGRVQANGVDDVVIGDTLFINRGGVGTQGDVNGLVDVGDGGGQVVTGTAGDGGRAVGDGGVGQLDIDGLGAVGEGIVKGGQGEAEAAGDEAVIKAQGAARAAHAGGQADGGVDVAQQGVGQVCIGGGADIGDVDTDDVGAGGGRVQANGVDDVVIGDTLFINRGGVGTQGDVNGLVDVGDGGGQVVTGTAGDGGRAVGDGGVGQLDIDGLGAVGEGIVKGGQGEAEAAGDEAVIKAQGAARAAHAGGQADGGVDVAQQGVGQVCIGGGADIGDVDTDDVGAGGGRVQANGVDDVVIGDTLFINRGGVGTQGDVNGLVDVGDGGGQVVTGTAGDGGRAVGDGGVGQLDIDGLGAVGEGIVKGGQGEAEAAGDEAVIKAQGAARAAHAGGQADGGVDVAQQGVGQVCIGGGADIGDVDTDDVGAGGGRVQANGVDDVVIGDTLFINRGGVGTQGDVNGLVDVGDGGGQVVTGTAGDGGRAVGDGGVGQLDIDGLGAVGEGIVKGGQGEAEAAGDEAVIKAQGAARAAHAGGRGDGGVDVAQQGVGQVCIGGGADIGDVDTDDVGAGGGRVQANGVDDVVIGDTLFINRGGVGTQGDVNGLVDVGDGGGQVVTGTAGDGGRAVGDGGVGQLDIDGLGAVGEGIVKGGQGEAEAAGDEGVSKAQGVAAGIVADAGDRQGRGDGGI